MWKSHLHVQLKNIQIGCYRFFHLYPRFLRPCFVTEKSIILFLELHASLFSTLESRLRRRHLQVTQ